MQNIANKKFVDITQQCFALLPQVNFPANNLNFQWKWRWWDRIQAIFSNHQISNQMQVKMNYGNLDLIYYIGKIAHVFDWVIILILITFFSYFAVFFNIWKRKTNQLQTWIRNLMELDEHQSLLELSLKASQFNLFLHNLPQNNVPVLHLLAYNWFQPILSPLLMFLKIRHT